ncbi:uncharacterized protein J4E84_002721 [Alternaria hordeiaustralica]|uniref:uncharacterized protein n=1 Tax=Alternaria hordeiaustralica TaxID=1187925 RepID=UPI0020C26F6D|nr:uncharacterized protein J4E84_002721 [Alternaria hordeiaustralica]KAI4694140.1 hypothetical protein J4E84_002721 [Alternaria hordeiaustralica]
MSSNSPEASSCSITDKLRSLRAEVDELAKTLASDSDSSTETLVGHTLSTQSADTYPGAETKPSTPSTSTNDADQNETREGHPSNSDDTDIVYHPHLRDVNSIPDLGSTLTELVDIPNDIIKRYYGDRIHFSKLYAGQPYTMAWCIKADDVLDPIAIVIRWPNDSSLDIVKKDDDGDSIAHVSRHQERTNTLGTAAANIRLKFGCDRIGFYDGVHLILFVFNDKPQSGVTVFVGWSDEIRYKLIMWLGEAIRNTNVQMLKPLVGYALEDSNLEAAALETPPQCFLYDKHIDNSEVSSALLTFGAQYGGCAFKIYTTPDGKLVKVGDSPLHTVDDSAIATPEGVLKSSQLTLIDFLVIAGKDHSPALKHSYDIVPDAITWYVRKTGERNAKELVGIVQFAPAGTIVPGDWGLRKPDLTFTNGEGIVRTAKPLLEAMLSFGQKRECYCLALFDYHNVVFVTRCKGTKVNASIALIGGERIRGGFLQWLIRALKIADEDFDAVQ